MPIKNNASGTSNNHFSRALSASVIFHMRAAEPENDIGAEQPHITNVTPYGYQDGKNEVPHSGLNDLLQKLGMPEVPDRSSRKARNNSPLTQPACYPQIDTYAMQQLSRIVSGKTPLTLLPGLGLKVNSKAVTCRLATGARAMAGFAWTGIFLAAWTAASVFARRGGVKGFDP